MQWPLIVDNTFAYISALALFYCVVVYSKIISKQFIGIIGLLFLVGFGYFSAYNVSFSSEKNHFSTQSNITFYKATINNLVEEKPKSWKATAQISTVFNDKLSKSCNGNVLLYFDKSTVSKPKYGDVLLIKGSPNVVDGPKNPFEFDYKKYLANQGIYHQQYLKDTSMVVIGHVVPNKFTYLAIATNNYFDSLFSAYITDKQELAVTNAMILGLRDDIDNDLIQAYSAAGAIHVLSVSGLHVGVIYIVLVWIFGFLKKLKPGGNALFLIVILSILWFYAAITGFSSPVLRSTFMFSLIVIAETINRQHNSYNTVAFSAFCLLVYNPLFLLNVGFLLSYLAVFGMILLQPMLNPLVVIEKNKSILHWLADRLWKVSTVAIAAQIATLPITIYFFHQFPNYFLLANPIVILLSSVVLICGLAFLFLAVVFNFAHLYMANHFMAIILQWFVKQLNNSVLFTERLPGAISKYLYVSFNEMLLLYLLLIAFVSLLKTKNYVWVKISLLLVAFLFGQNIVDFFKIRQQNIVCLQAIPKTSAISVFNGKIVNLFADAPFLEDRKNIGFRLNNQFAARNVNTVNKIPLTKHNDVKVWKGNSFMFLKTKADLNSNDHEYIKVDYLIVSNKKIRYFNDIKDKITFKYLIIDGNFTQFYANRFQLEAAQDGVLAYSLLKDGALTL
jgi:competence protein ComEC